MSNAHSFPQFGRFEHADYVPARVSSIAQRIRRLCAQRRSIPFDPYACCDELGIRVSMIDLPQGLSGRVRVTPSGPQIEVRSADHELRKRFTICHEIGHLCFLTTKPYSYREEGRSSYCDAADVREERYCDRIAEELLMPTTSFAAAANHHERNRTGVVAIARKFEVSISATLTRIRHLGLWSIHQQRWHVFACPAEMGVRSISAARYRACKKLRSFIDRKRTLDRMRAALREAFEIIGRDFRDQQLLKARLETSGYATIETKFGAVYVACGHGARFVDAYVVE
jgi:Zn-dependent peptidase ImmA (M78 family)